MNHHLILHLILFAAWEDPADTARNVSWARGFYAAMQPHVATGTFLSFMDGDEAANRIRASFGPNYERLVAVKRTYDPANLFRMNQNIPPA